LDAKFRQRIAEALAVGLAGDCPSPISSFLGSGDDRPSVQKKESAA
jgi:hypothetical protein